MSKEEDCIVCLSMVIIWHEEPPAYYLLCERIRPVACIQWMLLYAERYILCPVTIRLLNCRRCRLILDNIFMMSCSSSRLSAHRGKSDVEGGGEGPQHGDGVQCYWQSGAIHSLAQGLYSRRPVRPAHKAPAYRSVLAWWLAAASSWIIAL